MPEPSYRKDQDARVALAQTKVALRQANSRLISSRQIYARVRATYAGK